MTQTKWRRLVLHIQDERKLCIPLLSYFSQALQRLRKFARQPLQVVLRLTVCRQWALEAPPVRSVNTRPPSYASTSQPHPRWLHTQSASNGVRAAVIFVYIQKRLNPGLHS